MKNVIYTIYIDIAKEDLDPQPPHHGDTEDKNIKAKREFNLHKEWLIERQKEYAKKIDVEYLVFEADDKWEAFKNSYLEKYPVLTMYNIVNFYKIHLMYLLKEKYDYILYLDLDVVPIGDESFFDAWDLDKGVAILKNLAHVDREAAQIKKRETKFLETGKNHSIRSPTAKYWNSKALIQEHGSDLDPPVYNTGIVGISKSHLEQLAYFENFDEDIDLMTEIKNESPSMWPQYIQSIFGWDNETLWGVKMHLNDVPMQWLDTKWHYFMDRECLIPKYVSLIHVINKEFSFVREWCEKNNL